MKKFMEFMKKRLMPLASKMATSKHLTALNEIENIKKLFFDSIYNSHDINETIINSIKNSSVTLKSMGENINTSLNAMENVAEDIAQSTSKSEKLNEIVSKTNTAINNGNNFSENLYHQITQTEKSIGETLNTIKNLESNSKRISLFTRKINNISKQTNLLALNAAIEAARAGEAGKGFSIVAQEVKNLSQLTQEAASEIENELKSFVDEIGETIKKSEESKAILEKGLDLIEQTKEIYYELKSVDKEL
jgi:methyl-accepting chemotaxis protein